MSTSFDIGSSFSGCRILSRCGRGAYGVVYLAENAIGRKIVIKVVENADSSGRELQGVRNYMPVSGTHPNLLQIFHIGEMEDGFFYIMEAADELNPGEGTYTPATLGNMIRNGKQFTPGEAVHITRELLNGMTVFHDAKLVHRDIKPDNIIFVDGVPKLSDPGLVVEADSQVTLAGTPGFIPPEIIAKAQPADRKSDLYAIGKVFYCMITGKRAGEYPHLPETMPFEVKRQLFPVLSRMCNTNPAKRFSTTTEFLKELPESISEPNFLERKYKTFQDWKTLNREKFRFALYSLLTLLLLLIIFAGTKLFLEKREKVRIASQKLQFINFRSINRDRKELIAFQFQIMLPDQLKTYQAQEERLQKAADAGSWKKAAGYSKELQAFLQTAATKLLPVIPEKSGDLQQDFAVAGKARGYLTTPLSAYLPAKKRNDFLKQLRTHEKRLYGGWQGPRCQGEWNDFQVSFYAAVFIPPGAVKMDHNKKVVRIPYHFWMSKDEVSHAHFTRMTGNAPQKSPHPGTPVERVSWNDVLYYCRIMTTQLKSENTLPPGYIVRPPTEAEWEYAAKNAWLGRDTVPLKDRAVLRVNSNKRTMPSGSKQPNKLGLNDIYGNVHEIVQPIEPPAMKHSIVIRGGSFLSPEKACNRRVEVLKYQHIPYDIGFRTVIAPGDMSYFDKHFFLGGEPDQLKVNGKVFELLGENYGCFDWNRSNTLCRLLGGRLAELDSQELLNHIIKAMPLAASGWGCFFGGKKIDGKWRWMSSGKEITFGKWIQNRHTTGDHLTLHGRRWKPATENTRSGIFICEWDEKAYADRNQHLRSGRKLPLEAARFTIGNRRFILFHSHAAWYTARRVCELLGGRLACLDTPELQKQVMEKLSDFKDHHILLGGYAKWNQWYWLSGGEITQKLERNKDAPIPTLNKNFVTLYNGKFYNSQYSRSFLCEWDASIFSSN